MSPRNRIKSDNLQNFLKIVPFSESKLIGVPYICFAYCTWTLHYVAARRFKNVSQMKRMKPPNRIRAIICRSSIKFIPFSESKLFEVPSFCYGYCMRNLQYGDSSYSINRHLHVNYSTNLDNSVIKCRQKMPRISAPVTIELQ